MAITIDDFSKIWASTSPLTPYEFSESQYKEGWNFIGGTPPSRQMWDFLQKNNDEKMQYLANNYLPLSGGTMTGDIATEGFIKKTNNTYGLTLCGGSSASSSAGAKLDLSGADSSEYGSFVLQAGNENGYKQLKGNQNGSLTWDGNNILTNVFETFSGNATYSATGRKMGKLCIVNFALPSGFASGWHTTEEIITTNLPAARTPCIIGAVTSGADGNTIIHMSLGTDGLLYGHVSAGLNNNIEVSCVYFTS